MPLIHAELSERIIGCCITVHKELGPGFLEKIYEEALCLELEKAGLKYERQKPVLIPITMRSRIFHTKAAKSAKV